MFNKQAGGFLSLISPLLFIIYVNNVPSVVKHCEIQLYGDDTLL